MIRIRVRVVVMVMVMVITAQQLIAAGSTYINEGFKLWMNIFYFAGAFMNMDIQIKKKKLTFLY